MGVLKAKFCEVNVPKNQKYYDFSEHETITGIGSQYLYQN